jgi:hypothetical protein
MSFGYRRVAERDLPKAFGFLDKADAAGLAAATARALNQVEMAIERETGAIRSAEQIYTGSAVAKAAVDARLRQWELYRAALRGQVEGYAKVRAAVLLPPGAKGKRAATAVAEGSAAKAAAGARTPALSDAVKGREFQLGGYEPFAKYLKANPDALKKIGVTPAQASAILNYVNGRRTVAAIRNAVAAETEQDLTLESVGAFLDLLASVNWVTYSR